MLLSTLYTVCADLTLAKKKKDRSDGASGHGERDPIEVNSAYIIETIITFSSYQRCSHKLLGGGGAMKLNKQNTGNNEQE